MNELSTLFELLAYDDFAMSRLFEVALALPDAQLDRPFEMGLGSIRATLLHVLHASAIWQRRCVDDQNAKPPIFANQLPVAAIRTFWRANSSAWRDAVAALADDKALVRLMDYYDLRGTPHRTRALDIVLHVINHGVHHRAQAVNMMRHVGATAPRIDYITRKVENAPKLSIGLIRYYFQYSDWANRRVVNACASLTDAQLDQPFEMGIGTARTTIDHLHIAEQWWLEAWHGRGVIGFPKPWGAPSIEDLRERLEVTAQERNALIDSLKLDEELARLVEVQPSADRTVSFPLGVSMVQLCTHGTHHRAQLLNMLRHLGRQPPSTDFIQMTRELR